MIMMIMNIIRVNPYYENYGYYSSPVNNGSLPSLPPSCRAASWDDAATAMLTAACEYE